MNKVDIQTHEVSGLDVKTFVLHVRDAMTSFSSPCLFWLPYIFLALVFVEKLIVGCYRIRRAKAVSFECQSLIWVLELYPSVTHHSLTVGPSACIITLRQKTDGLKSHQSWTKALVEKRPLPCFITPRLLRDRGCGEFIPGCTKQSLLLP